MDETIDALSERLAPRHLMNEAMCWIRGGESSGTRGADAAAMAKNVGSMAWRHVKRHPMSAALIGAGVAWMFLENRHPIERARIRRHSREPRMYGGSYVDARTGRPYDEDYGETYHGETRHGGQSAAAEKAGEAWEKARGRASGAAASAQASMSGAAESARHGAEQLRQRARTAADTARHRASAAGTSLRGSAESARHYVGDAAEQARHRIADGYHYGRDKLSETIDDYPLAAGAAALGLGMLLGLAAPRSRREDQWLGETADDLKQRARETSREAIERGKHMAQATAAAAADEARKQGLTPSGLVEHGRHLADKVREDVQEEGMTPQGIREKVGAVAERARETAKQEVGQETEQDAKQEAGQE